MKKRRRFTLAGYGVFDDVGRPVDVGDEINVIEQPYPQLICSDCGEKYGRLTPTLTMTWFAEEGECEICGFTNSVTETRDFGYLKDGWQFFALEAMALEVVRAASIGDQHFIECLSGDDEATRRLRLAVVSLAEVLRAAF